MRIQKNSAKSKLSIRLAALAIIGCGAFVGCGTSPEFVEDPETPAPNRSHSDYHDSGGDYPAPDLPGTPALPGKPPLRSLMGKWKGVGEQSDGASWTVNLAITTERRGRCASVHYPSSGCTGYWVCRGGDEPGRITAVERITEGSCVDGVDVELELNSSGRTVSFFAAAGSVTAEARLGRGR